MIEEADRDGDGEISEDEFMRIMRKTNLFWAYKMVKVGAILPAASLPMVVWNSTALISNDDRIDEKASAVTSWEKIVAANE